MNDSKKYYIVKKSGRANAINATIKEVTALENKDGSKRYIDEDGSENFSYLNSEFCLNTEQEARDKVLSLINYFHEKEMEALIEKQKVEKNNLQKEIKLVKIS